MSALAADIANEDEIVLSAKEAEVACSAQLVVICVLVVAAYDEYDDVSASAENTANDDVVDSEA